MNHPKANMKSALISICFLFFLAVQAVGQDYKDFDAGVAKFRAGEYDAVIEMFSTMLANPGHNKRFDEDLYFYRGQSYYHKNEYTKALDDLNQSLTLDHYNRGVLYWYQARCYDKLGKKSEATASYKEALTNAEKNKKIAAQILLDRAQFNARNGDKAAADEDLAQAKALDPSNKNIAGATVVASTPTRNAGEEKKTTQVIIKNNASASEGYKERSHSLKTAAAGRPAVYTAGLSG